MQAHPYKKKIQGEAFKEMRQLPSTFPKTTSQALVNAELGHPGTLQLSLSLRDILQYVKDCDTCPVTTSQLPGTGIFRTPPLLGEGHGPRWQFVNQSLESQGSQGRQLASPYRVISNIPSAKSPVL